MVSLGKCTGNSNTLDDLSSIICLLNKTKGVFNMITGINELN